jgi:membrane-bound metal-dependent hydrolase YbcI (DUF457 family)
MLPPGHIAAGFLTAEALLKIAHPALTGLQKQQMLWWGMFFGFAPDLDSFVSFAREKAWFVKDKANNHRRFISHAPLLWALGGLGVWLFSRDVYWQTVGLLLWLASWSHFLLDSIEFGVMWLWPFNKEIWALKDRGIEGKFEGNSFLKYWINYLKFYFTRWTFYAEIFVLIVGLFFLFTIH